MEEAVAVAEVEAAVVAVEVQEVQGVIDIVDILGQAEEAQVVTHLIAEAVVEIITTVADIMVAEDIIAGRYLCHTP